METLGDRLKKLREKKNLLQKEVAGELNVSAQTYSRYENNLRYPDIFMLKKLAIYYNVSADYLLELDNRTYLDKKEMESHIKNLKNEINVIEKYMEISK